MIFILYSFHIKLVFFASVAFSTLPPTYIIFRENGNEKNNNREKMKSLLIILIEKKNKIMVKTSTKF